MASAAATARPISAKWVILGRFSHGVFCFAKPSFNSEWALIFLCLIGARLSCLADLASTSHGLSAYTDFGRPRRAPKVTVTRRWVSLCQKGVTQWLWFFC